MELKMNLIKKSAVLVAAVLFCTLAARAGAAADQLKLDTAKIEAATGAKGQMNAEEGVFKVSFPRSDVKVTVDGTPMPPFMGLTSWAAFKPGMKDGDVMVMGDMVLLQDEVNPVMSVALDSGLAVTALHNHFFYDEPKVYFMHIGGEGDSGKLAEAVRKVQETVKSIRATSKQAGKSFGGKALPEKSNVTAAPLAAALGSKATEKDGMVKFTIGRSTKMPCGCEVGKEMGVNTWAAFYGSDEQAFVDGDFATLDGELQPVLKALRANNINVVAIHNHMEGETPRVIFLHYWGVGPAAKLAQGVKSALEAQKGAAAKSQQ
jgi:hypothetical protein